MTIAIYRRMFLNKILNKQYYDHFDEVEKLLFEQNVMKHVIMISINQLMKLSDETDYEIKYYFQYLNMLILYIKTQRYQESQFILKEVSLFL